MSTTTTANVGKLHSDIKARWVTALRSGDYQQGQSYLGYRVTEDEARYCCLGVLCELAVQDEVITRDELDDDDEAIDHSWKAMFQFVGVDGQGEDQTTMPPTGVRQWAYAREPSTELAWSVIAHPNDHDAPAEFLPSLNDDGDYSFAEIADFIEQSL